MNGENESIDSPAFARSVAVIESHVFGITVGTSRFCGIDPFELKSRFIRIIITLFSVTVALLLTGCSHGTPRLFDSHKFRGDLTREANEIHISEYIKSGELIYVCGISEGDQPLSVMNDSGYEFPHIAESINEQQANAFSATEVGFVLFSPTDYRIFRASIGEFCCINLSDESCGPTESAVLERTSDSGPAIYSLVFRDR